MKYRDRIDLFLTLLAGIPLLASGLFTGWYVTSEMLADYRPALWLALAMATSLIAIGGGFCWAAWRRTHRIQTGYHQLYRLYPELADHWQRLSQQAQTGDADLGLFCYGQHFVVTAQGLALCPLDQLVTLDYQRQPVRVGRQLKEDHLFLIFRGTNDHRAQIRDLGRATPDREARLVACLHQIQALAPHRRPTSEN